MDFVTGRPAGPLTERPLFYFLSPRVSCSRQSGSALLPLLRLLVMRRETVGWIMSELSLEL